MTSVKLQDIRRHIRDEIYARCHFKTKAYDKKLQHMIPTIKFTFSKNWSCIDKYYKRANKLCGKLIPEKCSVFLPNVITTILYFHITYRFTIAAQTSRI